MGVSGAQVASGRAVLKATDVVEHQAMVEVGGSPVLEGPPLLKLRRAAR